jgi:type II secretory pathway predicted ATPase ExeA
MVLDYYKLRDQPFGVTPDPRYFYLSASHREALASLLYGIQSGRGFMSLIAKPGMGKTTILFQLLSQLKDSARTVFLFQTLCSPKELLRSLLHDLGVVDEDGDAVRMQERLNDVLLAEVRRQRKVVVIIDEAQNLEDRSLEMVRMLSNFETTSQKLMQIILAGQPQLHENLGSPHLLQLRQRISIPARLRPFSSEETNLYMCHRLRVAGYNFKTPLFTPRAAALIAKHSEGIPRNINNICFNALSVGRVLKQERIGEEVVRECLDDLDFDRNEAPAERHWLAFGARKASTVNRRPAPWRRRLPVCVMVLLQLLCLTGGQQRLEKQGSRSLSGVSSTSKLDKMQFPSSPEAVSSMSTGILRPQPQRDLQYDPTELWVQWTDEDSDAEGGLDRLFFKRTATPQNFVEAEMPLLATSRKGNTRAVDVLSAPGEGRH